MITGNALWFTCTAQKIANWPLNGTVTGTGTANNTVGKWLYSLYRRSTVSVISTDGRPLQRYAFVLQQGSNTLLLQQQSRAHGVYVLQVQTEDETQGRQFVY